jgi:hypothetical protein
VDLAAFIAGHVKAVRHEPSERQPRPVGCLVVEKVAARCVAAAAGVQRGDWLTLVDGSPAARESPQLYAHKAAKRLYSFYSTARKQATELATTGIDIGVAVDYTAEAVHARFKPHDPDLSALARLWELGECKTLLELSRAALAVKGNEGTPALLFEGVGLWEAGQYQPGLERIQEYIARYGRDWTMNFRAIGMHYLGLEALRSGHRDFGLAKLRDAFQYSPLEGTAEAIAEITGVRPPMETPVWLGRAFPCDYALEALEGEKKTVGLGETLGRMAEHQLLCVCVLCTYRSNGPYYELLGRFQNYATWFRELLAGLHVITAEPKRYADRAAHYRREDQLRALPLPFELLLEKGQVMTALAPQYSPFVVLLDRSGTVVFEGELDGVKLWDALARARA